VSTSVVGTDPQRLDGKMTMLPRRRPWIASVHSMAWRTRSAPSHRMNAKLSDSTRGPLCSLTCARG